MRLKDRIALVTGSSRGIGAAIALRLAAEGACIVLHGNENPDRAEAVAAEIKADGGQAHVVTGDLTSEDAPVRIVREAFEFCGGLDILVCNAGRGGLKHVVDQEADFLNRIIALNLRAVMLSVGEFARLTKSPHGRVVFISSGAASHPAYGSSAYAAAKAGAESYIRSAAQELGERGITLNSVAPGCTRTDMVAGQSWINKVPPWAALRRVGEPEDIADIVAFLASDDGRWLTGNTLAANGGLVTTAANILAYASDRGEKRD